MTPNKNDVEVAEKMTVCVWDGNDLPCEHPKWELEYHELMGHCLYEWDMAGAHGFDDPIVKFIGGLLAAERARVQEIAISAVPDEPQPTRESVQFDSPEIRGQKYGQHAAYRYARVAMLKAFKRDGMSE